MTEALHREFWELDRTYRYKFPGRYVKEVERHYLGYLVRLLQTRGYACQVMGANHHYDLLVNGVAVEVKIARSRKKRGRNGDRLTYYQFKVWSGGRRPPDGQIVMCLCVNGGVDDVCVFVIPIEECRAIKTIEITSDPFGYLGRWAKWRGAFSILDDFDGRALGGGMQPGRSSSPTQVAPTAEGMTS